MTRKRWFFFFFEIPVCKKNEWCSEYHMTFPDVIVMMLSDMGTVPRWTDLNASAAKLIFPSSRKFCHCCFLTFVFFAVVLKLFIVWFQVGTVKRNFISSTYYYFENNLVNIFLVLGELCPWGELALQRSFRPPRPPMFLIEGKNGICIITDCIKRMHSQDFFFFFPWSNAELSSWPNICAGVSKEMCDFLAYICFFGFFSFYKVHI